MVSVDAKAIERMPVANVGEAIIGRMPRVQGVGRGQTARPMPEITTVRECGGGSLTRETRHFAIDGFEGLPTMCPLLMSRISRCLRMPRRQLSMVREAPTVLCSSPPRRPTRARQGVGQRLCEDLRTPTKSTFSAPYDFVWSQSTSASAPKRASAGNGYAANFGQPYEMYPYLPGRGRQTGRISSSVLIPCPVARRQHQRRVPTSSVQTPHASGPAVGDARQWPCAGTTPTSTSNFKPF